MEVLAMSDIEMRIECLRLAASTASGHDILEVAAKYEAFVISGGCREGQESPQHGPSGTQPS
jgi:hypothetical protein